MKVQVETRREWGPAHHHGIPPEIKPLDLDPTKPFIHLELVPARLNKTIVRERYASLIHHWVAHGEGDWASPRLHSVREIEPGTWEITIVMSFTD